MRLMRLDDIITGIIIEMVKDGDVFEASNGDRCIYKNGVLSWVTIEGYISTPVTVTSENIDEYYKKVSKDESSRAEVRVVKRYVDCGKKLTEGDAYNIHHLYHFVKIPVAEIAKEYHISERMVYYILDGGHWADVFKKFHKDYCIVKDDYIR